MINKKMLVCIGIIFIISILGLLIFLGMFYSNNVNDKNFIAVTDNCIINDTVKTKITSTKEEKVSPNAQIIFKIKYSKCGHIVERKEIVEKEVVNLSKDEIINKYLEWNLDKFSSNEIVLSKETEGLCNEHYILKIKDENIAVYKNEFDEEELITITNISTKYLPEKDIDKLNTGIKIYGKEELSKILEDFGKK